MRLSLATQPAHPDRPNEDFIGATSDAVVLLDGAGTPAGLKTGCSHGVAWYAHTLGSTLLAAVTQSAGPLTETLAESIKNVASLHDFTCDLVHAGSPSATVSMLRRTGDVLEWLVLADSAVVLDTGTTEPTVICDDRVSRIGARYRALMDGLPGEAQNMPRRFVATSRRCAIIAIGTAVSGWPPLIPSPQNRPSPVPPRWIRCGQWHC